MVFGVGQAASECRKSSAGTRQSNRAGKLRGSLSVTIDTTSFLLRQWLCFAAPRPASAYSFSLLARCSAQRFLAASMMRLRPAALNRRFLAGALAGAAVSLAAAQRLR